MAAPAIEKLTLPDENTPLALQLVAARALAIAADQRAPKFVSKLAQSIPNNPDVAWTVSEMKK